MNRRFWPVGEAAQADYETLREAALSGLPVDSLTAARFARRGVAGLISWPLAEPVYTPVLVGAEREPWSPYTDARIDALVAGYELLLQMPTDCAAVQRIRRCG